MAETSHKQEPAEQKNEPEREPSGFGEHTRKSSSENAHEQGWGLNQEERTRVADEKQESQGGTDYDYGAQDFGDIPVDTSAAQPAPDTLRKNAKK